MPNESFILSTKMSISFRDFLPKFLNFMSSLLEPPGEYGRKAETQRN